MKDTNNLLDYNIWSGTDYKENIDRFNKTPISSNEWSNIGERSLKLTRTTDEYNNYTTETSGIELPANNYKLTANIYSPNAYGRIVMFTGDTDQVVVSFSPNPNTQVVSVQASNTKCRGFRLLNDTKGQSIWLDNVSLVIVS